MALDFEQQLLDEMPVEQRDLLFRLLDRLDELQLRAEHAGKEGDDARG